MISITFQLRKKHYTSLSLAASTNGSTFSLMASLFSSSRLAFFNDRCSVLDTSACSTLLSGILLNLNSSKKTRLVKASVNSARPGVEQNQIIGHFYQALHYIKSRQLWCVRICFEAYTNNLGITCLNNVRVRIERQYGSCMYSLFSIIRWSVVNMVGGKKMFARASLFKLGVRNFGMGNGQWPIASQDSFTSHLLNLELRLEAERKSFCFFMLRYFWNREFACASQPSIIFSMNNSHNNNIIIIMLCFVSFIIT